MQAAVSIAGIALMIAAATLTDLGSQARPPRTEAVLNQGGRPFWKPG